MDAIKAYALLAATALAAGCAAHPDPIIDMKGVEAALGRALDIPYHRSDARRAILCCARMSAFSRKMTFGSS